MNNHELCNLNSFKVTAELSKWFIKEIKSYFADGMSDKGISTGIVLGNTGSVFFPCSIFSNIGQNPLHRSYHLKKALQYNKKKIEVYIMIN